VTVDQVNAAMPRPRIEAEALPAPRLVQAPVVAVPGAPRRMAPLAVVGLGVVGLVFGLALLDAGNFVVAQFDRAAWLGWLTLGVAGAGFGAIFWGIWREIAGLRALARVDDLRRVLAGADLASARQAARRWAAGTEGGAELLRAIDAAPDAGSLSALLRDGPVAALAARAEALGRQAAVDAFAATAISPSPALDAALVAWRGVRLTRQVAALYGLRPGLFGTLALVRRTLVSAAAVAATDMASEAVARAVLSNPVLKHVGGEVAGAGIAARRMILLARAASAACSPVA
jgi:putative membrane protein